MKNLRTYTLLAMKSLRKPPASQPTTAKLSEINTETPVKVDYADMRLYRTKSGYDLFNMFTMNTLCTSDVFVDYCDKLYYFSNKLLGTKLTEKFIENTMGKIFTAGDNLETLDAFLKKWNQDHENVGIIIDYAKEAIPGQEFTKKILDNVCDVFTRTIEIASRNTSPGTYNKVALKVSALIQLDLLKKLNKAQDSLQEVFSQGYANLNESLTAREILERLKKLNIECEEADLREFLASFLNMNNIAEDLEARVTKLDWLSKMHAFYVFDLERNHNKILKQVTKLNNLEIAKLEDVAERFRMIFETAQEKKVGVLVDAEQTYFQSIIDSFAVQYGDVINKKGPIVLNTFQCYLKNSNDRVKFELERCKLIGVPFAAKFVRGAYMYEERRLALEHKYDSPIHESIDLTHQSYDDNLREAIPKLNGNCHLLVASHNEESVQLARDLIKKHNVIDQVSFAQLLGFADHITFSLAKEKIPITKYVPFGPLDTMIPYLIRRAQESRQMFSSGKLQRRLVLDELGHRLKLF